MLSDILDNDQPLIETLWLEGVDKEAVMAQVDAVLGDNAVDFESRLRELSEAEEKRNVALGPSSKWKDPENTIGLVMWGVSFAALLLLLGIGIAKWTGHIPRWPIWPFVIGPLALFVGGTALLAIDDNSQPDIRTPDTIKTETLRRNLRDQLRSLVIVPAIERASLPSFALLAEDKVFLVDAPRLTSRVRADSRIQTSSYREALPNLARDGGMTIGLAGSRGVGKSELLRAFCEDPDGSATMEGGGIIGIVVPAPVAYQAEPFLRVLIRQLAENVPGYREYTTLSQRFFSAKVAIAGTIAGVLGLAVGLTLLIGPKRMNKLTHNNLSHIFDWFLISISIAILAMVSARFLWDRISRTLVVSKVPRRRQDPGVEAAQKNLDIKATQINRQHRLELANTAANVARRIRYVESRTNSKESSYSWHDLGFKSTSGISWDQVPLSEPDLVIELATFVEKLSSGGYRVRIGIDELDKLANGDDAEKFLTGIKTLFTISDCSFLLTISENAAAQFARRGLPIRDVFDSSLDTVVKVRPLTYREARRLAVGRLRPLTAGSTERISDTQVLLCHCLSGGLPRDFLRYCRRLGEINLLLDGRQTLDHVLARLLNSDLRDRLDGIRSALLDKEQGEPVAVFMAEIERIYDISSGQGDAVCVLRSFISADARFASLCRLTGALRGEDKTAAEREEIGSARREIAVYLYFIETVRLAFGPDSIFASGATDDPMKIVIAFEALAEARRSMEVDSATGWRRITAARAVLGLEKVHVFDLPDE